MDVDLPPPGPLTSGGLRVTALGGINEIGRNMTVYLNLVAANVTDPIRIAQGVRRTVGKWVGETYRRQPMIVPTVIEV